MADSVKIRITGDSSEFEKTLSGIGNSTASMFKGVLASAAVTKGLSMLSSGLKSAIGTGMEFESAMSQVAAISGASADELERMTEAAKQYGETTQFTASDSADALKYMALAGWDVQQAMDGLPGVLNLAAASGMELGAASDAVTDYLTAFGLGAEKATYMADLMTYAQSNANTTAEMLADAYGNCAANMAAAGQNIETTTAFLMTLSNAGIKGSEAGTQMAAVMRDLTSKMKDGAVQIGKTAVTVMDSQGNFRDLNDIMMDVAAATEGMGTAEASAALMETFTARSVKAVQTILNQGMESVNQYEDALRGSQGTAEDAASTMMDNLAGDVKLYQSALEGLQITASEGFNDTAREVVQLGTQVISEINAAGKTGGIGGMADALVAQIPTLLPKIVAGAQQLLQGVGKRIPGLLKGVIGTIPNLLGSLGDLIPSLVTSATEAAGAVIEGVLANLPSMIPALISGIGKTLTSGISGLVVNFTNGIFDGIKGAMKSVGLIGSTVQDMFDEAYASATGNGLTVGDVELDDIKITGNIDTSEYISNVSAAIQTIIDWVDAQDTLTDEQKALLKQKILTASGIDEVKAALAEMGLSETDYSTVITSYETAGGTISASMAGIFEKVKQAFTDGNADNDTTAAEEAKQAVKDLVESGINDIDTAAQEAKDKLAEMGLSADELIAKQTEIDTEAQTAKANLIAAGDAAQTWLDENAGAATSVVQAHIDELDGIIQQVADAEGRVQALTDQLSSTNEAVRSGVESGQVTDQQYQVNAIEYTSKERDQAIIKAAEERNAARKQAEELMAQDDYEGANQMIADADAAYAAAEQQANENYRQHIDAIIQGMIKSNTDLTEFLESGIDFKKLDVATKMYEALQGQQQNQTIFNADELLASVGLTREDLTGIAEQLGMSVDDLVAQIQTDLDTGFTDLSINSTGGFFNIKDGIEKSLDGTVSDIDLSKTMEVLKVAIDNGLVQGVNDTNAGEVVGDALMKVLANGGEIDPLDIAVPVNTTVEPTSADTTQTNSAATKAVTEAQNKANTEAGKTTPVGLNFAQGIAQGISSGKSGVINAAVQLATAAIIATKNALDEHSPSRVARSIGEYFGQGFELGAMDSISSATASIREALSPANLTPALDFSGMTATFGDGFNQLAQAESSREISMYISGRKFGAVTAPYSNNALNRYATAINMGYGKG